MGTTTTSPVSSLSVSTPSPAPSTSTPTTSGKPAPFTASGKIVFDGITFDDVLLLPRRSGVMPAEADTSTRLTRSISLNIPLISAPMDTVTESALAIGLAQEGGIGIIHKNMPLEAQAREVEKVKRSENGVIVDPVVLTPANTIADARQVMREYNVSGIPIIDGEIKEVGQRVSSIGRPAKLVGILTRRDLKY